MSLNLGLTLHVGKETREIVLYQTPTIASLQIAPDRQLFGKEPGLSRYLKWVEESLEGATTKPPAFNQVEGYRNTAKLLRSQGAEDEAKQYDDFITEMASMGLHLTPLEEASKKIEQAAQELAAAYQVTPDKVQWLWHVN
jgi:hypothetical protein